MDSNEIVNDAVNVQRWPTETPLFVLVLLSAIACWIFLVLSIIGLVYAGMLGIFFFVSHVSFIAHLKGSAVRVGPDQMPELYERIEYLSRRVGLKAAPTVYVMQAGGTLNALATKFFSSNFVVLFSDLIEACGDNAEARDMIIAHELGHLKAGHLKGLWFLLPGMFIPFLGSAYFRAREYTCDRYGFCSLSGSESGAGRNEHSCRRGCQRTEGQPRCLCQSEKRSQHNLDDPGPVVVNPSPPGGSDRCRGSFACRE